MQYANCSELGPGTKTSTVSTKLAVLVLKRLVPVGLQLRPYEILRDDGSPRRALWRKPGPYSLNQMKFGTSKRFWLKNVNFECKI